MLDWWAPEVEVSLSQGDVFRATLFLANLVPPVPLRKTSLKAGQIAWIESQDENNESYRAKGKIRGCIVLTHSCELDKDKASPRVAIAPIQALSTVTDDGHRHNILMQRNHALLPLQGVPQLGDHYADLRSIVSVPRGLLSDTERVASMTEAGRDRLQAQVIAFFTRIALDDLR